MPDAYKPDMGASSPKSEDAPQPVKEGGFKRRHETSF